MSFSEAWRSRHDRPGYHPQPARATHALLATPFFFITDQLVISFEKRELRGNEWENDNDKYNNKEEAKEANSIIDTWDFENWEETAIRFGVYIAPMITKGRIEAKYLCLNSEHTVGKKYVTLNTGPHRAVLFPSVQLRQVTRGRGWKWGDIIRIRIGTRVVLELGPTGRFVQDLDLPPIRTNLATFLFLPLLFDYCYNYYYFFFLPFGISSARSPTRPAV